MAEKDICIMNLLRKKLLYFTAELQSSPMCVRERYIARCVRLGALRITVERCGIMTSSVLPVSSSICML